MKRVGVIGMIAFVLFFVASGLAQTVTIGFTVSRTGALNVDSVEMLRGFELWRDQVNAAGGIKADGKAYKINFVNYDDESNPQRVQQLYTRLILQDKATFLFGPYSSGLTATAAIVSEQNGKIMLTTGAEDKAYKLGNRYLFQMFAPAHVYLESALDAIKAKDPGSRVALVYGDDSFSTAVGHAAQAYAKQIGLNVVFDEAYSADTSDFGPIIDKIVAAKATAVMGGGHYADGSTLARQLYAHKTNVNFISLLVAPDSPKFTELGNAALGVTVPSQWEPQSAFKPQVGPTGVEFTKAYEAKYNQPPSYESAGGYASGMVLQHAIEQAGSINSDKVANALNATDLTTFYGRIKFATAANEHGLQIGHTMVLAQWQKDKSGKLVKEVVWPADVSTSALVFPLSRATTMYAGK
jgi:branched-chain amino acid transport system substrate-binding protein